MIELEKYKEALGFDAEGLSESEILKARQIQDDLAEIFYARWVEKKNKQKLIQQQWQELIKEETALSIAE